MRGHSGRWKWWKPFSFTREGDFAPTPGSLLPEPPMGLDSRGTELLTVNCVCVMNSIIHELGRVEHREQTAVIDQEISQQLAAVVLTAVDSTVALTCIGKLRLSVHHSSSLLIWACCSSVLYVPTTWRSDSTPSFKPCFSDLQRATSWLHVLSPIGQSFQIYEKKSTKVFFYYK